MRVKDARARRKTARNLRFVDAKTARERAKVIHAYSGRKQPELAKQAGMDYEKLRPVFSKRGRAIDTEDLVQLAAAAGVPEWFARAGWDGVPTTPENSELADRLRAQEAQAVLLGNRVDRLEAAVRRLADGRGPANGQSR